MLTRPVCLHMSMTYDACPEASMATGYGTVGAGIKELVALELFREGHISTGKAAELLG